MDSMKANVLRKTCSYLLVAAIPLISQMPGVADLWQPTSAVAQNVNKKSALQLRLNAEKQIVAQDQQGKQTKVWQPLKGQAVVQPGDVLRYTLTGENTSDRPIKNVTINQPIPQGMVYVMKSITAPDDTKITYSVDGGRSFTENPTVQVRLPNGQVETRPAPASAYTHLQFKLPELGAKTTLKATYKTQVR